MSEAAGVVMATEQPDGARLLLSGMLDGPSCERLAAFLDDVAAPGAVVTVDLSHVENLPLAALRCLAAAHRRMRDGGGRLVLEQPSVPAVRALRTSGLARALEVRAQASGTRTSSRPVRMSSRAPATAKSAGR